MLTWGISTRLRIPLVCNVIVLPSLLLNYFGQGALPLTHPEATENPFFRLAPGVGDAATGAARRRGSGHRITGGHTRAFSLTDEGGSSGSSRGAPRLITPRRLITGTVSDRAH